MDQLAALADQAANPGADWSYGGFGVYIHWPFCLSKCPYCDFNSHVRREVDQARWSRALDLELEAMRQRSGARQVDSLFFGGGTPSLMAPETVGAAIETVQRFWGLTDNAEITLEANPTSIEAGRFRGYAEAGVNRVSIGVQALNDAHLTALGRTHTALEARAAFDIARSAFDRVSFDLIYARVDQTFEAWRGELTEALAMAVDHLSLYQLTIEPETRFAELQARGKLRVPSDEKSAAMFAVTQEICEAMGVPAYEVSNHARPGAESRHNLVYWRYGDYAGVGPGAHGRLTSNGKRWATETVRGPEAWLNRVEAMGDGLTQAVELSLSEQADEMMLMGLRLSEGVDMTRYTALSGRTLQEERITPLLEQELLTIEGKQLRATATGRPVLNALLRTLLA
ncbi:MAG: radical SAM family heme chaperone HemW [Rhodobacteraceae bacterium]|nr:radical SAM family heme chaperone HemW [Paracoccaceae bacterium]